MTIEERVRVAIARHADWDDRRIANSCTAPINLVRAIRVGEPIPVPATAEPKSESAGMVTLEKIKQKYDIKAAIEREMATIPAGKLIEEGELCRRTAGTDRRRFRIAVENNADALRAFRVRLKLDEGEPKWFWGSAHDVETAKRICEL